jgi:predicted RNA-binding Zn-ribbon protein involved in translation (DUF1610 family)
MGDLKTSIVPSRSSYPGKEQKAQEILDWLIGEKIVRAELSDCVLRENQLGYAIAEGARDILEDPSSAFSGLLTCGLDISQERTVFYQTELEKVTCPSCGIYIGNLEDGEHFMQWLDEWYGEAKDNFECPSCHKEFDLNEFTFQPQWAFSDLGFTFWNWGAFKPSFITAFEEKIGCPVNVVQTKI